MTARWRFARIFWIFFWVTRIEKNGRRCTDKGCTFEKALGELPDNSETNRLLLPRIQPGTGSDYFSFSTFSHCTLEHVPSGGSGPRCTMGSKDLIRGLTCWFCRNRSSLCPACTRLVIYLIWSIDGYACYNCSVSYKYSLVFAYWINPVTWPTVQLPRHTYAESRCD